MTVIAIPILDTAAILQAKRDYLVSLMPEVAPIVDLASEPSRKSLEENAYREFHMRTVINENFLQTFIAHATGAVLEERVGFYDVTRITGESDAQLRLRGTLEIRSRSTGGTEPRYRAIALGASADVRDAKVWCDGLSPVINVAITSTAPGGLASSELLNTVATALNDPSKRMINDTIAVRAAVTRIQPVAADIWLLPDTPAALATDLPARVRSAWEAEAGLGFDLTRAWLCARLMQQGVQRVELATPATDISVQPHEALALGEFNLAFKGRAF